MYAFGRCYEQGYTELVLYAGGREQGKSCLYSVQYRSYAANKDYDKSMDDYIDNIKNLPKAKGKEKIMMPDEIEWEKKRKV